MRAIKWKRRLENLFWQWITRSLWSSVLYWWRHPNCHFLNARFLALALFSRAWGCAGRWRCWCRLPKINWIRQIPELADILIWLGIIGAIIGIIWQYFYHAKKRTPPECLLARFRALPITGDHWIAVVCHSNCRAKIDQSIYAKGQIRKPGLSP